MPEFFGRSLFVLLLLASTRASALRVVIDAGHGGRDDGATLDGLREADVTLTVSRALEKELAQDSRYEVKLSRTVDQTVSLAARSKLANRWPADLFLSLHANSSHVKSVKGAELYVYGQAADSDESMFLAHQEDQLKDDSDVESQSGSSLSADVRAILQELTRARHLDLSVGLARNLKSTWTSTLHRPAPHIRQAPFHVLANVHAPAVLIEMGYLTNQQDLNWMTRPHAAEQIARTIKKALDQSFEKIDKESRPGDSGDHDNIPAVSASR